MESYLTMRTPRNTARAAMLGTKIALLIAGTAALVALAVGLMVHRWTGAGLLDEARRALDGDLVRAAQDYAAGRHPQARLNPSDLPVPAAEAVHRGQRVTYLADTPGGPVLWAATLVSDSTVLALRRPYDRESRSLASLDRSLLAAGSVTTVVALVAGLGTGVRLGRRATAAARTAERIAAGDLDARVRPAGRDEISRLAASVDTMADALGARLEAERRVTADIAHDLRTPVAGMIAAADLLPPSRPAELVQERAEALHRLIEDVLEVARLDVHTSPPVVEACLLSSSARRAVASLGEAGRGVSIQIVDDAVAETDPRRVERIVANLVANAVRHGRSPVEVEVTDHRITVRDHGPGFADDLLSVLRTSGPQRFRTGSPQRGQGVGLGLTIAAGQARVLGAGLRFDNHPEDGAQVTLDL